MTTNFATIVDRIISAKVFQYVADYLNKHTSYLQELAAILQNIDLRLRDFLDATTAASVNSHWFRQGWYRLEGLVMEIKKL